MSVQPARDLTQTVLRLLFIGALVGVSILIGLPFIPATIWAVMIVIATWPLMLKVESLLGGKRGRAVAVMSLLLLLTVAVPSVLAAITVFENSGTAVAWLQSFKTEPLPQPPAWLESVPVVGATVASAWKNAIAAGSESLVARVVPYLGKVFDWFVGTMGGLGVLVIQFCLMVIISAILFSNGEQAATGVRMFAVRLAGDRGEKITILAGKAIRGIALGVVVTAVLQTVATGIGLAVAGVPAASLLTVLAFVLCIAQIGPGLILFASIGWLYWSGNNLAGTLLLVYTIPVVLLDNVIRPVLIKKGVDLPLLLIMAGVIGGLMAFGIVGIFVGPVVLAVTYTLLEDWVAHPTDGDHSTAV